MWYVKELLNDVDEENGKEVFYNGGNEEDEASVPFDEYLKLIKSYVYRTDPIFQFEKPKPTPEIMEYIRDNKNQKKGVMYAFREGNVVYSGWSLCHRINKFDKERGLDIAKARAEKVRDGERLSIIDDIPYSITNKFLDFLERRCVTYFKDAIIFRF